MNKSFLFLLALALLACTKTSEKKNLEYLKIDKIVFSLKVPNNDDIPYLKNDSVSWQKQETTTNEKFINFEAAYKFRDAELKRIRHQLRKLVLAKRLTCLSALEEIYLVSRYDQFPVGDDGSWCGMYKFYQPAFDQAMRSWHTNVYVNNDTLRCNAVDFDSSVVGYRAQIAGFDGGFKTHEVTVIKRIDNHTLILSESAKQYIDGYIATIIPQDYDDNICNCLM